MADLKISALTASTTPLAGTEVLPIVQSSTTKQVSVANLTAGRATSAASFTATKAYANTSDLGVVIDSNIPGWNLRASGGGRLSMVTGYIGTDISSMLTGTGTNNPSVEVMRVTHSSGDVNFVSGNVSVSTASKGYSLPGGITWTSGSGSPEGVVTAPIGSLYSRTDGGLLTSLYVKQSGSGNTGWAGK